MGGGFLRKIFESEISKNKQIVIANLGPTWDCRIWILGMWTVPDPVLILAATSKNIYKTCIIISRKIQNIYIKLPINPP